MTITKRIMMVIAAVIMAASLLHYSTAQTTHVVGDDLGWTIPPYGPMAYSNWAKNQTFMMGDVLVFNFMPGVHDVVQVTKSNYESCNTNNRISAHSNSPATVPLHEEGEHYFICSFRGHCLAGQKIMINVLSVNGATLKSPTSSSIHSPTSASAPAPATSTHSPTSASSSNGVRVAIFATFMSALFALFGL